MQVAHRSFDEGYEAFLFSFGGKDLYLPLRQEKVQLMKDRQKLRDQQQKTRSNVLNQHQKQTNIPKL